MRFISHRNENSMRCPRLQISLLKKSNEEEKAMPDIWLEETSRN